MANDFYRFGMMADGSGHRLDISGEILPEIPWVDKMLGISAHITGGKEFCDQLRAIDGQTLTVVIDSPGGDFGAGVTMYEELRQRKGETRCLVIRAYSAATLPLMAIPKGKRYISPAGTVMIHDPSASAKGTERVMAKCGEFLRELKKATLEAYHQGTGKSKAELDAMMSAETMMAAKQAIDHGFADAMAETGQMATMHADAFRAYMVASDEVTAKLLHAAAKAADEDKERAEILRHLHDIRV